MLKVTQDELTAQLDAYLQRALTQPVQIVAAGHQAVVMLPATEYARLQEVDDQHWTACARRANKEGYLDHEQEVRRRLAAAMNEKRLQRCTDHAPSDQQQ